MNGFNVVPGGHPVNVLGPVSISGGKTGQAFSMANAEHVSILINFGVMGAALPTAILVNQCTSAAGANATAMGFRWYIQVAAGSGNDVFAGPNQATAAGILAAALPATVLNCQIVIEIDAAELEAIASVVGAITEYPYLQVQITDSGNVTFASVVAILSGLRYAYTTGQTATT